LFVAACLQQALAVAGGSTCGEGMITIREEGGGLSCAPQPTYNRSLLSPRRVVKAGAGSIDLAGMLHNYCESSNIKAVLVDSCKKKHLKNCDSLSFHHTYIKNPKNNNEHSYYFKGKVVYHNSDVKKKGLHKHSRFNQAFQNGNKKQPDSTDYKKTVTRSASYSWTFSASSTVSTSISTKIDVDIPLVAKVGVSTTDSFSITAGGSTGGSHTTTQSWSINQHIVEEPDSCTRVCVLEDEGDAIVPFGMHGTFQGHAKKYISWAGTNDAFVCCYLRPGGANDCGSDAWGTQPPGNGWALSSTLAAAVDHDDSRRRRSLTSHADHSVSFYRLGEFKADMNFDVLVKTKKGPYNKCPSAKVCDNMGTDSFGTNSSSPEFVV
jgi:hypothetical protein